MMNILIIASGGLIFFALAKNDFNLLLLSLAINLPSILIFVLGNKKRIRNSKKFADELDSARHKVHLRTSELFREAATSSKNDQFQHVLKGLKEDVASLTKEQTALQFQILSEIESVEKRHRSIQLLDEERQLKLQELKRQRQELDEGMADLSYYVRFITKSPRGTLPNSTSKNDLTPRSGSAKFSHIQLSNAIDTAPAGYWKSTSNVWGEAKDGTVTDIDGINGEFEDAAVIDMYHKIEQLKSEGRCVALSAE